MPVRIEVLVKRIEEKKAKTTWGWEAGGGAEAEGEAGNFMEQTVNVYSTRFCSGVHPRQKPV